MEPVAPVEPVVAEPVVVVDVEPDVKPSDEPLPTPVRPDVHPDEPVTTHLFITIVTPVIT